MQWLCNMNLVVIRFNPDDYIDSSGNLIKGYWSNKTISNKLERERRLGVLKETIDEYLLNDNVKFETRQKIKTIKLFYDDVEGLTIYNRTQLQRKIALSLKINKDETEDERKKRVREYQLKYNERKAYQKKGISSKKVFSIETKEFSQQSV